MNRALAILAAAFLWGVGATALRAGDNDDHSPPSERALDDATSRQDGTSPVEPQKVKDTTPTEPKLIRAEKNGPKHARRLSTADRPGPKHRSQRASLADRNLKHGTKAARMKKKPAT